MRKAREEKTKETTTVKMKTFGSGAEESQYEFSYCLVSCLVLLLNMADVKSNGRPQQTQNLSGSETGAVKTPEPLIKAQNVRACGWRPTESTMLTTRLLASMAANRA